MLLVSASDMHQLPLLGANLHPGAFVAAPIGGLLWGFAAFALRISTHFVLAKIRGDRFTALDRPARPAPAPVFYTGGVVVEDDATPAHGGYYGDQQSKFF